MATAETVSAETEDILASEYLNALIYLALLERGEAAKVSEITIEINNPRITFPLVRRALGDSPLFLPVDRMWNLSARYMDRARPTERNLREILDAAARPLSVSQAATELSSVYGRPAEVYLQLLGKLIQNKKLYFRIPNGEFGPVGWLPLVDADELEDILFDNGLTHDEIEPFAEAASGIRFADGYAPATLALTNALGNRPLQHRVVGVLAWMELGAKYDPVAHLLSCLAEPELVWLTGRWITQVHADRLEAVLEERGQYLTEEEPEEMALPPVELEEETPEPVAETTAVPTLPEPVATPLLVKPEDLDAMERIMQDRGAAVDAVDLLALQYEVVAGDPSWRGDLETLINTLREDDRFQYVGAGRFREPNSLPLFVFTVPESLAFPNPQFVSLDGEIMDEEIEDEGFAGTLRADMLNPLAQDVGDDEGRYTGIEPIDLDSVTLVLKAHHKEIGTFPLCQVPESFFPHDAPVVELIVRDASGVAHDVIVNHDIRMMFNLFGLYEQLSADSGGVFRLHRTSRAYEFRWEIVAENDAQVYINEERMEELVALREQAEEGGDMATFDIACEVLAHHVKGLDFVQAMTEVNIVRRVTRRKLASILSNYYCFVQKPGQNLWRYDSKKRGMGTDHTMRKYLKR